MSAPTDPRLSQADEGDVDRGPTPSSEQFAKDVATGVRGGREWHARFGHLWYSSGTPELPFPAQDQPRASALPANVHHMTGQTRKRKRARVQRRAESPDNTESSSSEDRSGQSDPALQHVSSGQPLSPTEQALDTTVANTPTSVSFQIWEIIIDQLFAYRPGTGWTLTFNPNEQSLEGEAAQSFLNCRET